MNQQVHPITGDSRGIGAVIDTHPSVHQRVRLPREASSVAMAPVDVSGGR